MKSLVQGNNNTNSNSFNTDEVLDNLIERVTNKLVKLKNKHYLLEYLIKTGLSIDLAKQMIEGKHKKHQNKTKEVGVKNWNSGYFVNAIHSNIPDIKLERKTFRSVTAFEGFLLLKIFQNKIKRVLKQ